MQAVVLHAAGDMRLDEVPEPAAPGPGEAVVSVDYGGVCGSDLHYWQHGSAGTSRLREPMVLGHEAAGRVAALGTRDGADGAEDPDGLEVGTPVAIHPATTCRACRECRTGRTHLCPQVAYLGSAAQLPHTQGAFAQRRVVRRDQLRPLPYGVDTRAGAVAEPLAVAVHAVGRGAGAFRPGRPGAGEGLAGARVLVNGAGPIGCLAVAAARAAGAVEVVAADLAEPALAVAERMGATDTAVAGRDELPADVDVCLEASGAPAALGSCLTAVRRGGTLVQVGNLPAGPLTAELAPLVSREISYLGSFRFDAEIADSVRLLAEGLDVEPLLTGSFPLAELDRAFSTAADPATPGKTLLDFRDSAEC